MLIPLVLKWAYMVSVSKFKCCIAKTNVCLLWGWCRDLGLVDHVPVVAFSVHGAHAWVLAVAIAVIGGIRFVDLGFVVVGYNGFDICHSTIAQCKRVPVKNFVKRVWFREMLINERKEALSNIRFDILAERWIVPKSVSWTVLPWLLFLIGRLIVRQVIIVTTFIEGFLVHSFGIVKAFSVRWYFWKPFVDGIWDVFQDRWWVIGLLLHIQWDVTFLYVWVVFAAPQVKRDI